MSQILEKAMSEELYEPLPNIDAYLERIGISEAKEPSLAFLDELINAHQHAVPFDNLDVSDLNLVPSLAISDLFDKIVVRKRGGYCFELNALFGALLKGLGFATRPAMARVTLRPIPYPLISHRANIVSIEGHDYLADVGFGGPMPNFAPLLEDGASRTERNQTFTLHRADDWWWNVGFTGTSGEEKVVLRICAMPVGEEDFIPLSFYQATYPESVFRLNRMANIKTPTGAWNLRNMTFTEFSGGNKTVTELQTNEELQDVLREKFGIAL